MKKVICALAALLVVMAMAIPAFAQEPTEASMPVTIELKGDAPKKGEDFTIQVEMVEDSPVPAGAEGDTYKFTITGADTGEFTIKFDQVGDYQYIVRQLKGKNKDCTYDTSEYLVTFQVRNTMEEDGVTIDGDAEFKITAIAHPIQSEKDGEYVLGDKTYSIVFTNRYKSDSPATGDTSNPALYVTMVGLGLAVAVVLLVTRKPKEIEE